MFIDIYWYSRIFIHIHLYLMTFINIHRYELMFNDIQLYSMILLDIHWYSMTFNDMHWYSSIFITLDMHWYLLIFIDTALRAFWELVSWYANVDFSLRFLAFGVLWTLWESTSWLTDSFSIASKGIFGCTRAEAL